MKKDIGMTFLPKQHPCPGCPAASADGLTFSTGAQERIESLEAQLSQCQAEYKNSRRMLKSCSDEVQTLEAELEKAKALAETYAEYKKIEYEMTCAHTVYTLDDFYNAKRNLDKAHERYKNDE